MNDFDGIYREFQPRIHRYLCRLCGEADVQDLTQATFLKVSQSLDGFRGESSLATWIYRIATNTARNHICVNPCPFVDIFRAPFLGPTRNDDFAGERISPDRGEYWQKYGQ